MGGDRMVVGGELVEGEKMWVEKFLYEWSIGVSG